MLSLISLDVILHSFLREVTNDATNQPADHEGDHGSRENRRGRIARGQPVSGRRRERGQRETGCNDASGNL